MLVICFLFSFSSLIAWPSGGGFVLLSLLFSFWVPFCILPVYVLEPLFWVSFSIYLLFIDKKNKIAKWFVNNHQQK